MRRPHLTALGAVAALLGGVLTVGASPGTAVGADQPAGVVSAPAATSEASQEKVADYWTPKRMRNAKVADAPAASTASSAVVKSGAARKRSPRRPLPL